MGITPWGHPGPMAFPTQEEHLGQGPAPMKDHPHLELPPQAVPSHRRSRFLSDPRWAVRPWP